NGGNIMKIHKNFKLFSLNSNKVLAEEISRKLNVPLGKCSVNRFSDGEIQINIEESIRGCEVYIIQSTSKPVNSHLMELLIMIDALKRASAKQINVVAPYFGYSRQDRKSQSREPISAKLVANLLETAGADRLITLDLHAPQIQGFFDIPVDQLHGLPVLADYYKNKKLKDVVVVSPDHGAVNMARKLASILNTPIALIDKRRPKANQVEVMNLIGDIKGKKAIIVDDLIDTASTITLAAKTLIEKGATEVYVCCTHPVLSGYAIEKIKNSKIKELVVTNSINISLNTLNNNNKIIKISIASLLSEAIIRIHNQISLSSLFR